MVFVRIDRVRIDIYNPDLTYQFRAPFRIYSEAKKIEINAVQNKNIWASLDSKLYQIGSMIVMNAKQDGLGISLWRFVSYFLLFNINFLRH
jgi:hypothetical protein